LRSFIIKAVRGKYKRQKIKKNRINNMVKTSTIIENRRCVDDEFEEVAITGTCNHTESVRALVRFTNRKTPRRNLVVTMTTTEKAKVKTKGQLKKNFFMKTKSKKRMKTACGKKESKGGVRNEAANEVAHVERAEVRDRLCRSLQCNKGEGRCLAALAATPKPTKSDEERDRRHKNRDGKEDRAGSAKSNVNSSESRPS
jgi:hypothetical protein